MALLRSVGNLDRLQFGPLLLVLPSRRTFALAVHFASTHTTNIHSRDVKALILLGVNLVVYGVLWVAKFAVFNKVLFKHHEPRLESVSA